MKSELTAEKLSDDSLEEVSGGAWTIAWALPSAAAITAVTVIPAVSCAVASKRCKKDSKKARNMGDVEQSEALKKKSKSLKNVAKGLGVTSVIPGVITVVAACAGLRLM